MRRNSFLKSFVMAASVLSLTVLPAYLPACGAEFDKEPVQGSYLSKEQFTEYNLWTNYINDYPKDPFGYLNRANIQYTARDYRSAMADYNKAISLDSSNAEAYLKRGNCNFVMKANSQALLDYTSALQINPKLGEAYFNMGRVYYEQNDFNRAVENMKKGVALNGNRSDYLYELGRAQYKLGDFDNAYNNFTSALSFEPNNADALFARGLAALNMNRYDSALQSFTKVGELSPKYPNLQGYKGMALYQMGDFRNAILAFDSALASNQTDGALYNLRGCAKELAGDKNGARKDYKLAKDYGVENVGLTDDAKRVLSQRPESNIVDETKTVTHEMYTDLQSQADFAYGTKVPITSEERGILDESVYDRMIQEKLDSGDVYGTVALLEKRAEAEPQNPENYLKLAKTKLDLGSYSSVISDAETAIMNGANNPDAYYLEGMAYKKKGNKVYAYRNFAMSYNADKQNPDYIYNLADASFDIGRYHEAYDLVSTILNNNLEDKYPDARLLLAKTEYKLGKYYSAIDDCNKYLSVKENKKSAEAYMYSAFSKEALEKYDDAIKDYSKAIKYGDGNDPKLYRYRGKLNLAQGHEIKAIHDFEKIVSLKGDEATAQERMLVAQLEEDAGNYNNAIACYSKFIKQDALNDSAYLARAEAYAKKGDLYNAIADYSTTLRLNPYQTSVYKDRGILLVKIRSYRRGAEDITKALMLEPENGQLYYYRALANKALGRIKEAAADYEKAKEFEAL